MFPDFRNFDRKGNHGGKDAWAWRRHVRQSTSPWYDEGTSCERILRSNPTSLVNAAILIICPRLAAHHQETLAGKELSSFLSGLSFGCRLATGYLHLFAPLPGDNNWHDYGFQCTKIPPLLYGCPGIPHGWLRGNDLGVPVEDEPPVIWI